MNITISPEYLEQIVKVIKGFDVRGFESNASRVDLVRTLENIVDQARKAATKKEDEPKDGE